MPRIESQVEWWHVVEEYKSWLRDMIERFHPSSDARSVGDLQSFPITAVGAEKVCEQAREEIRAQEKGLSISPEERFDRALASLDWGALLTLFSATWVGIPESMGAHSIPGFGALCDLCSESWVFEEEGENAP